MELTLSAAREIFKQMRDRNQLVQKLHELFDLGSPILKDGSKGNQIKVPGLGNPYRGEGECTNDYPGLL